MLKKILIALAAIVVVVVVVVALQPSEFRVTRTAVISAPAPAVFAQVNDFHKWEAWSPWARLDPAMKQTYEGAREGPGAIYRWAGNREVGEGSMTITESQARIPQALRRDQHRGVRRGEQFHGQGRPPLHEHGHHGRRQFREGAGPHEIGGGSEAQAVAGRLGGGDPPRAA